MWWIRHFSKFNNHFEYYQQNIITCLENKSTLRSRKSTLRDAYARVGTARDIRSAIVQK